MTFLEQVTPVLLTYNEEQNIERTLARLEWASDIVVVDSHSSDDTLTIARRHKAVRVFERPFDSFANQWNYAIRETGIATDWILALDADYILPDGFVDELRTLPLMSDAHGYRAGFRYCVAGRPLLGTLYPAVTVLFRKNKAEYVEDGHAMRVMIEGPISNLHAKILHDDRKPLLRWLHSQMEYARIEADHLLSAPPSTLRMIDRVRLMAWPAPILVSPYTLLVKRCLLDGWPGWFYALQRLLAETMIALAILDARLRRRQGSNANQSSPDDPS